MESICAFLDRRSYEFREELEFTEMVVYSFLAFAIPFIFSHPQLLTGSIVNSFLVLSAMHLKSKKLIPVILLPSIAAVLHGVVFGPLTVFLIYMLPFIWMGNSILVLSVKYFHAVRKTNYLATIIGGSLAKAVFLFSAAFALNYLGLVPDVFLTAMGIVQLGTALAGGVVARILVQVLTFWK